MATKKSMLVFFGILFIAAWVLGSATKIGAQTMTMKCKYATVVTKMETIPVSDAEGHTLSLYISEGLAFFENGEIVKTRSHGYVDSSPGKGPELMGYFVFTFEDGSTIVNKFERRLQAEQSGRFSAKSTSELIKGTGRFEGIKGTSSTIGKNFPASKSEPARSSGDMTLTYTLPSK